MEAEEEVAQVPVLGVGGSVLRLCLFLAFLSLYVFKQSWSNCVQAVS